MAFRKDKKTMTDTESGRLQSPDADRESVLSAWAIEPLLQRETSVQTEQSRPERNGYVFCRKCYAVFSAKDVCCPCCGMMNKRS